jgi:hypothetical protein
MHLATVTVKVTQENIDKAVGPDPAYQILKASLAEAGFPAAEFGITAVWLDGVKGARFAALPKEVLRFKIKVNNAVAPPEPFFFDLDVRRVEGMEGACTCGDTYDPNCPVLKRTFAAVGL